MRVGSAIFGVFYAFKRAPARPGRRSGILWAIPVDNRQKISFATEVAFNALISQSDKLGLGGRPVTGLEYLSDLEACQRFKQACRDVLVSLGVKLPADPDGDDPAA